MKIGCEKGGIFSWHGLGRGTFAAFDFAPLPAFDLAQVAPYNLGLHFGTREAAQSRVVPSRTARDSRAAPAQESPSAFNRRLNVSLRRLFRSLGYDGLVYANEIESPSDSYCLTFRKGKTSFHF